MCVSVCLSLTLHHPGNILAYDSLSEDGPPEDVTDGTVWGLPHLLQLKLCPMAERVERTRRAAPLCVSVLAHLSAYLPPSSHPE